MPSFDFSPDGWWDNLYLLLERVSTPGDVVDGDTTLYDCATARQATLSWHLIVYDTSSVETDCAVWGHDPSSLGTSCTEWF